MACSARGMVGLKQASEARTKVGPWRQLLDCVVDREAIVNTVAAATHGSKKAGRGFCNASTGLTGGGSGGGERG